MNTYLITYDLFNPECNLADVVYAIQLISVDEAHIMPHVHKISTAMSAADIKAHLSLVLLESDRVMITELHGDAALYQPERGAEFGIGTGRREVISGESVTGRIISEVPHLPC